MRSMDANTEVDFEDMASWAGFVLPATSKGCLMTFWKKTKDGLRGLRMDISIYLFECLKSSTKRTSQAARFHRSHRSVFLLRTWLEEVQCQSLMMPMLCRASCRTMSPGFCELLQVTF